LETRGLSRRQQKRRVERLDREFHTLLQLSQRGHPNLIRVYDTGQDAGVPYYVMEYIDGLTLEEALAERPRLGPLLHSFAQLCGGVALLHQLGIRHRDLKPSNILMRKDGGAPVLIDFGVCLTPAERTLTNPHELLGMPWYLSPEYARHWLDPQQVEPYLAMPTDDVWALGVMLYEVLTGAVPWRTPPSRREALMQEIQEAEIPHPSDVYAQAPRALGDVVLQMLAHQPKDRLANASAVIHALKRVASDADVFTPIAPRRAPGRSPTRRKTPPRTAGHIQTAMVATVAGLFLAVGLGSLALPGKPGSTFPLDTLTSTGANLPGPKVGNLVATTLLIPNGPAVPFHRAAPCPDGIEVFNGYCWGQLKLSSEQTKGGSCNSLSLYEPSKGWCRAHQAGYLPFLEENESNAIIP